MNMFARASRNLSLTPIERSLLKLIGSFIITGLIAVLPTVYALEQALVNNVYNFDWGHQLVYLGLALVVAIAHALAKYISAQGNAPLALVVDTVATGLTPSTTTTTTTTTGSLPDIALMPQPNGTASTPVKVSRTTEATLPPT